VVVRGVYVVAGVRRVRATEGPDLLVCGSSTLTSALLDEGLVDEVVLLVYPLLLGQGTRFVSDGAGPRELELVGTKVSPTGVMINTYRYLGTVPKGSGTAKTHG
jgi:dihydrofolate reductase